MTILNHPELYKKLYKNNLEVSKVHKIGIYFKKKQMWGMWIWIFLKS